MENEIEYFIVENDYVATSDTELSIKFGDILRIILKEQDWWYCQQLIGLEKGWISPDYGHQFNYSSPYRNVDNSQKQKRKVEIFKRIENVESQFVSKLTIFRDLVINPLYLRDSQSKRNILADPPLAVCFNLVLEILDSCTHFLTSLRSTSSGFDMAKTYKEFAPSLLLFGSLSTERPQAILSIKACGYYIKDFLKENNVPEDIHIEECLLQLPQDHYNKYCENFKEFVWLTSEDRPEYPAMILAFDEFEKQSSIVDLKLKEEFDSCELIVLQEKFADHTKIFTSGRKLIKEGSIEKLRGDKNDPKLVVYYAHLFNDILIYSLVNRAGTSYKMKKIIDLKCVTCENFDEAQSLEQFGVTNVFTVSSVVDNTKSLDVFRCSSEELSNEWYNEIKSEVQSIKIKESKKNKHLRASVFTAASGNVSDLNYGPRATCIYKFLLSESLHQETFSKMMNVLINPLIVSSRGGSLVVGSEISLDSKNKAKYSVMTEALQAADIQIFLKSCAGLLLGVKELIANISSHCASLKWSEKIEIGKNFTSINTRKLLAQYKAYSSGQIATLRALKESLFLEFYNEADAGLAAYPGAIHEKIENPRNRIKVYFSFLESLLAITPDDHPDYNQLKESVEIVSKNSIEIEEVIRVKLNFEQLLRIQSSIISGIIKRNPVIESLPSTARTFIIENSLKKVCRKDIKTFQFWLFNDILIYGSPLGNNTFSFNRSLDLKSCSVELHKKELYKNAFEINGAEKSFIVIAPNASIQQNWYKKIYDAINALNCNQTPKENAPIWRTDTSSEQCCICQVGFTLFRRKHHCRKCGEIVCGDHSKARMILTHIHATEKHRICDLCVNKKEEEIVKVVAEIIVDSPPAGPKSLPPGSIPPVVNLPPPPVVNLPPPPVVNSLPPILSEDHLTSPPPPIPVKVVKPVKSEFAKYEKMMKILPEEVVRNKMHLDGIDQADIDKICGSSVPPVSIVNKLPPPVPPPMANKPPPPAPPTTNKPPPPAPPTTNKPPPPVPPPMANNPLPTVVDNFSPVTASSESIDSRFIKYVKMTKMLPEEIVRHKMHADGFSQDEINSLFPNSIPVSSSKQPPPTSNNKPPPPPDNTRRPSLPPPSSVPKPPSNKPVLTLSLQEQIAQVGKNNLKKVVLVEKPPPTLSSQELLMQSLKDGGKHLKSTKDQKPIEKPVLKQSVGLMGMLSTAMLDRRGQIEIDSDGSSDGGFGSDDDNDEWGES